jgi:hypothetical protein
VGEFDEKKPTVSQLRYRLTPGKYREYLYPWNSDYLTRHPFFFGLLTSGSFEAAIRVVLDFYITKLLPWPIDELYLAQTIAELVISHGITVGVGTVSATFNYWRAI